MALFKQLARSYRKYEPNNENDYVLIDDVSITCWIYGFHSPLNQHVIGMPSLGYAIYLKSIDGFSYLAARIGNTEIVDPNRINDREWFHATLTWDGELLQLYKNGILVKTGLSKITFGDRKHEKAIWALSDTKGGNNFHLGLNLFTIWGSVLGSNDISNLSNKNDFELSLIDGIVLGDFLDREDSSQVFGLKAATTTLVNIDIVESTISPFPDGIVPFDVPIIDFSSSSTSSLSSSSLSSSSDSSVSSLSSSSISSSSSSPLSSSSDSSTSSLSSLSSISSESSVSISESSISSQSTISSISSNSSQSSSISSQSSESSDLSSDSSLSTSSPSSGLSSSSSSPSISSQSSNLSPSSSSPSSDLSSSSSSQSSSLSSPSSISSASSLSSNSSISSQTTSISSQSSESLSSVSESSISSESTSSSTSSSESSSSTEILSSHSTSSSSPSSVSEPAGSTDLVGWFTADTITGLSDGDTVTTWEDQSASLSDATLNNGAPKYRTGHFANGKPVVDFTSSTSSSGALISPYVSNWDSPTGEITLAALVKVEGTVNEARMIAALNNNFGSSSWSSIKLGIWARLLGGADPSIGAVGNGNSALPTVFGITTSVWVFALAELQVTAPNLVLYNGETQVDSSSPGSTSPTAGWNLAIGGKSGTGFGNFNGYLAEVMFWDRKLSSSEKNQTWNYIESKWGINI